MGYVEQRDAILVHAVAAAAAVDSTWTDVAIGVKTPDARCVRVYYGGEREPARMGGRRVINAELVSHAIVLAAFWPLSGLGLDAYKATEDQAHGFVHELRTRVLGDSQLGGTSTDLEMGYATPDVVVIGNARWQLVEVVFVTDFTEYTIAA